MLYHKHDCQTKKSIVLVKINDPGHTPYATYWVNPTGDCFWGHYHNDFEVALADFNAR